MQRLVGFLMCALLALSGLANPTFAAAPVEAVPAAQDKAIADQYIVVLKDGPSISASSVAATAGVTPKFVYASVLNGFAARLSAGQLNALQKHPQVAYIEQDSEVSIQVSQVVGANQWGLDRIDQRSLPLNGFYTYNTTAPNVTAYVIDTGIYPQGQFSGRVTNPFDAFGGNGVDCHGYGTHLAGTVGSATYGVAKGVQLRGVRVLDCFRTGSVSTLIAGIDYVRVSAVKPAVALIGATGGPSTALDNAVTNLSGSGVFVVVAAGDQGSNACNYSPSRVVGVMTVGATSSSDARPSWSNSGACVDMHAPGVSILSTWLGSTSTVSGTAMAAAHVAGCAAKYKATYGDTTQAALNQWLIDNATLVGGVRLLYCPL